MNTPLLLARRYYALFRGRGLVHTISRIGVGAVAFVTMLLVLVLSVVNGFSGLLGDLYGTFDPDLRIEAAAGKVFVLDSAMREKVAGLEGVDFQVEVLEDNALARYRDAQKVVTVKGVSDNFLKQADFGNSVVEGIFAIEEGGSPRALVGSGITYELSIFFPSPNRGIEFWYPNRHQKYLSGGNPLTAFRQEIVRPSGSFAIEQRFDQQYVIVPLEVAQRLFDYGDERSALELHALPGTNLKRMQSELKERLGPDFRVLTSEELHGSLLRILRIEKLVAFAIISFILAVASLNIFYALSLLVIDKRRDLTILRAQGATSRQIRAIFLWEGLLVGVTGTAIGLLLGFLIGYSQVRFGWLKMGMETAIVDAYPLELQWTDFAGTALVAILVTMLATLRPARQAARLGQPERLSR